MRGFGSAQFLSLSNILIFIKRKADKRTEHYRERQKVGQKSGVNEGHNSLTGRGRAVKKNKSKNIQGWRVEGF